MQEIIAEDIQKLVLFWWLAAWPVFAALEQLTWWFVRILKEPRNALLNKYFSLLSYDDVGVEFDDEVSPRNC